MRFPLFIDLAGKKAVVVGGGKIGLRRAGVLRDFGAAVTVIAPTLREPMEGVTVALRRYSPGDLEGAFLAVAATDDPSVNRQVEEEARKRGILINTADRQERCDFFFPAICRGEGLTAGLVGDGSDHHKVAQAAKEIRRVLEEME